MLPASRDLGMMCKRSRAGSTGKLVCGGFVKQCIHTLFFVNNQFGAMGGLLAMRAWLHLCSWTSCPGEVRHKGFLCCGAYQALHV